MLGNFVKKYLLNMVIDQKFNETLLCEKVSNRQLMSYKDGQYVEESVIIFKFTKVKQL